MTVATTTKHRPSVGARRFGYLVAVLVNAALLYAVNVWPGWQILPFLTEEMTEVLGIVNASIIVGMAVNVVYVLNDTRPVRALGELATTVVAIAAIVRMWQVFPFDFEGYSFDWALVVRVLLVLGIIGSAIGLVTQLVSLVSDTHSRG